MEILRYYNGDGMRYDFRTKVTEKEIRQLKIGDIIFISGNIFTMRDRTHVRALDYLKKNREIPVNLNEGIIYHCGPLVKKDNNGWKVLSCGPTTSMRMENIEADLIKKFKIKIIIGKGGMGKKTLSALSDFGAVYTSFTGGAGVLAAEKVLEIEDVHWLDLGIPEALWVLKVNNFGPLIVTMDSHMNDMYKNIIESPKG
jgi:fumarate hydratase subunit beta